MNDWNSVTAAQKIADMILPSLNDDLDLGVERGELVDALIGNFAVRAWAIEQKYVAERLKAVGDAFNVMADFYDAATDECDDFAEYCRQYGMIQFHVDEAALAPVDYRRTHSPEYGPIALVRRQDRDE